MSNPKFTAGQTVYWRRPPSRTYSKMEVVRAYDQPPSVRVATPLTPGTIRSNREEWIVRPEELLTVEEYEKQPS